VAADKRHRHSHLISKTRIKICGLTDPYQACQAAYAGADAIGFIYHPSSPRHISKEQAAAIRKALPVFVSLVAVMVNPSRHQVEEILSEVQPDILQFHGDEEESFCSSFIRPYIKAVKAKSRSYIEAQVADYSSASALLIDSYQEDKFGGTGLNFDYSMIPPQLARQLIIAGGLNPHNVAPLVQTLDPYGVDVSSGVESALGKKDMKKINAFIDAVTNAR